MSIVARRRILPVFEIFASLSRKKRKESTPIFILGSPRSGTTLLSQVLTKSLELDFMSNLRCHFVGAPFLASYFGIPSEKIHEATYSSEYGATQGAGSPSECGEWWYRFFPRGNQPVNYEDLSKSQKRRFLRSSRLLLDSENPFLFKNLYNVFRIDPLSKVFPNALYVLVERDIFDTASSILNARKDTFGNVERWFSIRPPLRPELEYMRPQEQAAIQVVEINRLIRNELERNRIPKSRVLKVNYEDLCEDPERISIMFQNFLSSQGVKVIYKGGLPRSFPKRKSSLPDGIDYDETISFINSLDFGH